MANLDLGYDSKDTVNREWEEEETLQVYIPCQQKNEFNEDDDWFDRPYRSLNYTHAVIKEKLNFLFLKLTLYQTHCWSQKSWSSGSKKSFLQNNLELYFLTHLTLQYCSQKKHVYLEQGWTKVSAVYGVLDDNLVTHWKKKICQLTYIEEDNTHQSWREFSHLKLMMRQRMFSTQLISFLK